MNTRYTYRIAVDIEGGDKGPDEVIYGALRALFQLPERDFSIVLVGRQRVIEGILSSGRCKGLYRKVSDRVHIHNAPTVVTMRDKPEEVFVSRPDSSIAQGISLLVNDGSAHAFVSVGNTGAVVLHAVRSLGMLPGLTTAPPIGGIIPTQTGSCIVVDIGANPIARPSTLLQFAIMGRAYAHCVLGIANPRVGLLNIGEEPSKGTPVLVRAHKMLKEFIPNFVGNVEGRDVPGGKADVVVCDGFVGNAMIKFAEGIFSAIKRASIAMPQWEKFALGLALLALLVPPLLILAFQPTWFLLAYIPALALAAALVIPAIRYIMKRFDYRSYGGAPLLGLAKGTVIICHGRSGWKAVVSAIRQARTSVKSGIREAIQRELAQLNYTESS